MDTIVLKLGGGAITYKDENLRRARVEVIRRAARELRRACQEQPSRIVAVHGAGPFGHSLVASYGIAEGVGTPTAVEGFVETHSSVADLNRQVTTIFREEGCLVFPIQPSACVVQQDRRIEELFLEPVQRLLELDARIVPLLYGDMAVDLARGASVVSGDAIVAELGRRLDARRVLLGTDVPGLFTADPKLVPTARRVERIDRDNLEQVLRGVGEATTIDVTSGMRGKLLNIAAALAGREVFVFDLSEEESLYRALTGRTVEGTTICL